MQVGAIIGQGYTGGNEIFGQRHLYRRLTPKSPLAMKLALHLAATSSNRRA